MMMGKPKPPIPKPPAARKSTAATGFARLQVKKRRTVAPARTPFGRRSLLTEPQLKALEKKEMEESVRSLVYDGKRTRARLALCLLGRAATAAGAPGAWGALDLDGRVELIDRVYSESRAHKPEAPLVPARPEGMRATRILRRGEHHERHAAASKMQRLFQKRQKELERKRREDASRLAEQRRLEAELSHDASQKYYHADLEPTLRRRQERDLESIATRHRAELEVGAGRLVVVHESPAEAAALGALHSTRAAKMAKYHQRAHELKIARHQDERVRPSFFFFFSTLPRTTSVRTDAFWGPGMRIDPRGRKNSGVTSPSPSYLDVDVNRRYSKLITRHRDERTRLTARVARKFHRHLDRALAERHDMSRNAYKERHVNEVRSAAFATIQLHAAGAPHLGIDDVDKNAVAMQKAFLRAKHETELDLLHLKHQEAMDAAVDERQARADARARAHKERELRRASLRKERERAYGVKAQHTHSVVGHHSPHQGHHRALPENHHHSLRIQAARDLASDEAAARLQRHFRRRSSTTTKKEARRPPSNRASRSDLLDLDDGAGEIRVHRRSRDDLDEIHVVIAGARGRRASRDDLDEIENVGDRHAERQVAVTKLQRVLRRRATRRAEAALQRQLGGL